MKSVTKKQQNTSNLPDKDSSAGQSARRRRRIPRWLLICLSVLVLLLAAGGGYLIFMPHVQPLSLPKLPKNLTETDLGLENWQMYRQALPEKPLDDPRLPASPTIDADLAA